MGKWDWTEPLDCHLTTAYYEYQALIVLQTLYPDRYANIIRADKPDLQDELLGIGIEVVRALEGEYGQIEGELAKYYHEKDSWKKSECKEKLIKLGGNFSKDDIEVYSWPPTHDRFIEIFEALKIKLSKLNRGGYKRFQQYDLFIHSNILANEEMLNKALREKLEIQTKYKNTFHYVYVYVPGAIYTFDLCEQKHITVELDSTWQAEKNCEARERAERNE